VGKETHTCGEEVGQKVLSVSHSLPGKEHGKKFFLEKKGKGGFN
jgi:hypothetical protein